MTIDEAIRFSEEVAEELNEKACDLYENEDYENAKDYIWGAKEHRQLAEWLKILKKAKFEYDEAWRIITHPTPDVNYADKQRAQVILDTFRNSLGVIE